ncbi:MAG: transcription initiation factor IIB [Nitrososphaeraceae archaeon]|jgi:transcription initiation factor TFIIB
MLKSKLVCKMCSQTSDVITDAEAGEIICTNCGMVKSTDRAFQQSTPEWRAFDYNQMRDRSRVGMPMTLTRHDKGLSTVIGRPNKDASGKGLDDSMRTMMQRLRTWDHRIQVSSPTDRNLARAFQSLEILKGKLGLPDNVIEKAAYIYRKVQQLGMVKGRTIAATLAASIYVASREAGIPRTLAEIATLNNTSYKELSRVYRLIVLNLDLKVPMVDPVKCIAKIANKMEVSEKTKRHAINYMHAVITRGIAAGKDPMGLAGAVLYLSCIHGDEHRNQLDVAAASGVTEVTLRNRCKELNTKIPHLN